MLTTQDEGKGLVKVYWKDIRKRVAKVEPEFTKLVDELDPDKNFPLFLCYLPYGAMQSDTKGILLPNSNGGFNGISDSSIPDDVKKYLTYSNEGYPLAMVLEKNLEFYIDREEEGVSIPWAIYSPGSFFGFGVHLVKFKQRNYAPTSVLQVSSGARSVFMLPNIGCNINHVNLQRDLNILSSPPKFLYDHWNTFKEIINSEAVKCDWSSCIIYFSEAWVVNINENPSWLKLKLYLLNLAWERFAYERSRIHYEIAFTTILNKRHLKPNPYLADTAKHLFATALGAVPGYAPAINDDLLPASLLQKIYVESYGLDKYLPIIMQPEHYNLEKEKLPIYYSLQYPSTFVLSPKSRQLSSTLNELRELDHILRIFVNELSKSNNICSETVIGKVAREYTFKTYHNKFDPHNVVKMANEVPKVDERFCGQSYQYKSTKAEFPSDAPFVRGCISISPKTQ